MKSRWLQLLLVLSLLGNAIEVGLYARSRFLPAPFPGSVLDRQLIGQLHLRAVTPQWQKAMDSLKERQEFNQLELMVLIYDSLPDTTAVRRLAEDWGGLQRERFRVAYLSARDLPTIEKPGVRRSMEARWRSMMALD